MRRARPGSKCTPIRAAGESLSSSATLPSANGAEDERLTTRKLESLGTLAGGIAHDLNNILTVISGNIGLAQLDAPQHSGNLLSFLAKAGQAAQHAARLSSQFLTFSKGGAPLKKIASVADLLQHAAEFSLHGSNLRAAIEIEDHLGKAEIDVGQVEQVINALIINAREAMPNGGCVDVSAENVQIDEKSGLPLEPAATSKLRSPTMARECRSMWCRRFSILISRRKPSSTGLGLAISYSIIRKAWRLCSISRTIRRPARPSPSTCRRPRLRWCTTRLQPTRPLLTSMNSAFW